MKQLELGMAGGVTRTPVEAFLRTRLSSPLRVIWTENRRTMLSARRRDGVLHLRLHRIFEAAPREVLEAVAGFVAGDDVGASRCLDRFIAERAPRIPRPVRRLRPRGRVHDLRTIFDEQNERFFHGACAASITWGRGGRRRRWRSIQLGLYRPDERLISIHPCLDQTFVPRFYVGWVVYHEMLHDVFGVARRGERRSVHPPEFALLEETYPDHARCKRWEERNLSRLLAYTGP